MKQFILTHREVSDLQVAEDTANAAQRKKLLDQISKKHKVKNDPNTLSLNLPLACGQGEELEEKPTIEVKNPTSPSIAEDHNKFLRIEDLRAFVLIPLKEDLTYGSRSVDTVLNEAVEQGGEILKITDSGILIYFPSL